MEAKAKSLGMHCINGLSVFSVHKASVYFHYLCTKNPVSQFVQKGEPKIQNNKLKFCIFIAGQESS